MQTPISQQGLYLLTNPRYQDTELQTKSLTGVDSICSVNYVFGYSSTGDNNCGAVALTVGFCLFSSGRKRILRTSCSSFSPSESVHLSSQGCYQNFRILL